LGPVGKISRIDVGHTIAVDISHHRNEHPGKGDSGRVRFRDKGRFGIEAVIDVELAAGSSSARSRTDDHRAATPTRCRAESVTLTFAVDRREPLTILAGEDVGPSDAAVTRG